MVQTVCHRVADPAMVRRLWEAITYVRQQRQISNTDRVQRYCHREYGMSPSAVEKHLNDAVDDQLIDSYTTVGFKGQNTGVEQEGFRLRDHDPDYDKGSHDWYCFKCHKAGEVLECSDCWRVFHPACAEGSDVGDDKYCCHICEVARRKPRLKRKMVNKLLAYTSLRLREKTKELHKLFGRKDEEHFERLVFHPMDINTMDDKTKAKRYKYLQQYEADCDLIYHNIHICYGGASPLAELAIVCRKDCKYDLEEVNLCKDCYYYSNAKPTDWFCLPCSPAHDLVYAKQKGFSYWPAKVIQRTTTGADVRFFGGWHQRAVIQDSSIKSIDSDLKRLNIKKSAGFNRAMQEMRRHQELLATMSDEVEEPEDEEEEPLEEPIKVKKPKKSYSKADGNKASPSKAQLDDPKLQTSASTVNIKKLKSPEISKRSLFSAFEGDQKVDEPPKKRAKNRVIEEDPTSPAMPVLTAKSPLQKPSAPKNPAPKNPAPKPPTLKPPTLKPSAPKPATPKTPKRPKHRESLSDKESRHEITSTNDKHVEDNDLVTSTEDNFRTTHTGTQTKKNARQLTKAIQTEETVAVSSTCDNNHGPVIGELKSVSGDDDDGVSQAKKEEALRQLEEKLRKELEADKQKALARVTENLKKVKEEGSEKVAEQRQHFLDEIKRLAQKHAAEMSATKKKQWCYFCEEEAMYHCCWNTSYCSNKCQQEHWQKEHKRLCRRKR